eukprot:1155602-Pelagomonas_calceolata.AAC.6
MHKVEESGWGVHWLRKCAGLKSPVGCMSQEKLCAMRLNGPPNKAAELNAMSVLQSSVCYVSALKSSVLCQCIGAQCDIALKLVLGSSVCYVSASKPNVLGQCFEVKCFEVIVLKLKVLCQCFECFDVGALKLGGPSHEITRLSEPSDKAGNAISRLLCAHVRIAMC